MQNLHGQMPSAKTKSTTALIQIDDVKQQVESQLNKKLTWFYSQSTGSTNSDLLKHKQADAIAIAEAQTQGRGQRQNKWQSTYAENLLFSVSMVLNVNEQLTLLPIKVGLALQKVLSQMGFEQIQLKWPNDLFYKGKKVGGILVESITQNKQALLVVGVGLNVNMQTSTKTPFTALKQSEALINRSLLLIQCLLAIFKLKKQTDVVYAFNKVHLYHEKNITFQHENATIKGRCKGINEHGQLLIQTSQKLNAYLTGSIVRVSDVSA